MVESHADQPLTDQDIIRLGIEAGTKVLGMSEDPTAHELDAAKTDLGYRAVELAYRQPVMPEGVDS